MSRRFATAGVRTQQIRALGGGSRSPIWKQIEADVAGVPVVTTQQADAGALGAAILAGVGIGEFGSISEGIDATVVVDRIYEPNRANVTRYDELFKSYVALYESLVPNFAVAAGSR